jgi:hypothetical protein
MIDLNRASLAEIVAAGFEPDRARELGFWRPYRSWDDPLLLATLDEAAVERLQCHGFEIGALNDAAWAAPKPFKLSAQAA